MNRIVEPVTVLCGGFISIPEIHATQAEIWFLDAPLGPMTAPNNNVRCAPDSGTKRTLR